MKRLLPIAVLVLFSCRTPESVRSVMKEQVQAEMINRIALNEDAVRSELTEQELVRLISERYKVSIRQVKYDTDRPVDSLTGKHPVKEETVTVIEKDTETNESEKVNRCVAESRKTEADAIAELTETVHTELTEKRKTGLNGLQKGLMYAGGLSILLILIFVIIKLKSWI
jgi:predicted RND superfamily exporter protein